MVKEEYIGTVKHYYSKVHVAVIALVSDVEQGDNMRFESDFTFEQPLNSMEADHKPVTSAKAGDLIGVKVDHKVGAGDEVYKVLR